MIGAAIEGGRVAVGGATAKALTAGVGTVALMSMIKFRRLLKMHPVEGRKNEDNSIKWE